MICTMSGSLFIPIFILPVLGGEHSESKQSHGRSPVFLGDLVAGVTRHIRVTVSGTAGFAEVARSRIGQSGFA